MPNLPTEVNKSTYGRLTQWGAKCLMARMYLNAGVYTGTPMWNECLEQCNDIINSGLFSLETNYTDIFKTENSGCVETVSYTHLRAHRDGLLSRMPSSA